jgi:predicted type IV restriction endonuclease
MSASIEDLLNRLRQDQGLFLAGEEAVRQGAILPVLARLGWDRDNVREVVPEFAVGNGRVDYCLKVEERNAAFVEVKRTNQDLEQHQEQLLEYAFRVGVEIAALTNGLSWWLYLPLAEGRWDQRKFFTIDIQQQDSSVIRVITFRWRERIAKPSVHRTSLQVSFDELWSGLKRRAVVGAAIPPNTIALIWRRPVKPFSNFPGRLGGCRCSVRQAWGREVIW